MDGSKGSIIDVRSRIQHLSNLPSLAVVKYQLIRSLNKDSASIDDISDIIRHDQAIASRVLAVANSAFLGFPGKIGAIEQAVMLLGFDLVRSISLAASIFNAFASQYGNFKQMWAHSYVVANIAANLCDKVSIKEKSTCFLSGLLHDIGRLTLFKVAADSNFDGEIQELLKGKGEALLMMESELFKCTHPEAAKWFLDNLCFPEEITVPIETHHSILKEGPYAGISNMMFLAEGLSDLVYPHFIHDGQWTEEHQRLFLENGLGEKEIGELKVFVDKEQASIAQFFDL